MGLFLSLAGIIGKSQQEVAASMERYVQANGGHFAKADLGPNDDNFCVLTESNNNTSFLYPHWLMDWDDVSQYLSQDLQAPVFSFHIHDGDLWMYIFFVNGEELDHFNPLPEYWDDNTSQEEMELWQGNAALVAKHVPSVQVADIERYLVHWDLDMESEKAYPDDESVNEDWQLLDFMRKLGLTYPLTDDQGPKGTVYSWQGNATEE